MIRAIFHEPKLIRGAWEKLGVDMTHFLLEE